MATERNVLATIRAHAESHRRMADCDAYSAQEAPRLESALAAVAGLVRTADRVAYALTQDGRTSDGISKEAASNRLRAALAPFQTGGAK